WHHLDPLGPARARYGRLRAIGVPHAAMRSWTALAEHLFVRALREGGTFHLWGHSAEVERFGMWAELGSFLAFVARQRGVTHVTNGEIAKSFPPAA
ncbi:MAG TPA: hypothetical protein PKE47_17370, partial [Verrucomicrobiota bacterium]|nr:hypothetical protein [Verrucomicrobiota bacterium]